MKKKIFLVTAFMLIITIGMLCTAGCFAFGSSESSIVSGDYRESNLSISLDKKNKFEYRNSISNTVTNGEYTCKLSEDGKKAYVTLIHNSRWCSYNGAVIYFFEGETWLVPTIDGKEVTARRMVKVS